MTDPLGLSIGTTNLVAARVGNPPLVRRSVLPLSGQVLSGFVERIGDPVPLIADNGASYRADVLMVEALDAMVLAAGAGDSSQIAVAVPAHWTGDTLRALRDAMRTTPRLAPNGTPARLVSDAVAALTALGANPGLPVRGVVALLDFGGGGTSITLADAAAAFEPIETTRLTEFSGDQIDAALLAHVLDDIAEEVDPAGTAAVGSLTYLREDCRRAKEELSLASAAEVRVELPGHRSAVRVTREQLDALMATPLAAVLSELDESLLRNRIAMADVSAVVAVGGGARIPLVTARLSADGRRPFVTTPQPALDAAVGAALFAAYGAEADAQTGVAPTPLIAGAAAGSDGPGSATFRALAWSQDDDSVADPTPYTGDDSYTVPHGGPFDDAYGADTGATRGAAPYHPKDAYDEPRSWQRLPGLIVGVAAVIALVAVGGVAIALTSATDETRPAPKTAPITATSVPPTVPPTSAELPPPPTEVPPQNIVTVTSEAPPPPPPETVTVERPVTTTTTTQPTTTTTTPPTTTTATTTTTTTTTTPTMTTSYITVPFVPVPIPIQVPSTPTPEAPQYQPPLYQQPPQFPY